MTEAGTPLRGSRNENARDRTIRVAHVAGFAETSASGVDRTVVGLLTHLDRFGVLPEVWHLSPNHAGVSERQVGPIKVIALPARERAKSMLFGLPDATRRFVELQRDEVDLVHLHSVFIPDNVWVARMAQRPYVITPNGGYSPEVIKGRNRVAKLMWMAARERAYVRAASLVQAVSPRELRQLRTMFGSIPLGFVPNAIEIPAAGWDPKIRLTQRRRIVFLGRLAVDHKGLDLLLEGYARHVRRTRDPASELIIAGPDFRGGRAELQTLVASLLPETRVSLPGPLFGGDKEALMKSAYVFVHTSRWEGMPYAVLEALATGCPVILTAATNLGEFVEDFRAGLVVDPTPDDIGEGLTRMLGAPVKRYEAMCLAARRLVSERFTWATVAEQMSAAYRRILR